MSRLTAIRPKIPCAVQSTRFYSVQTSSEAKVENTEPDQEDDKLYKRLEIELRAHDKAVLKSYVKFARTTAQHLDIHVGKR